MSLGEALREMGQSQAAARLATYSQMSGPAFLSPKRPSHPKSIREKSFARWAAVGQGMSRQKSFIPSAGSDDVVGVAAGDHVPTEVGIVGGFGNRWDWIEMLEDALLGGGDVVPEGGVDVFGSVEVEHFVGAGCTVDLGDSLGNFVLDVGVLVEADEYVPGVDVEESECGVFGVL